MNSRKLSVIKWTGLILTITIGLLLVACGSDGVTNGEMDDRNGI